MTSAERREVRYQRRVARREAKKEQKLSPHDDFALVTDIDNLYQSYRDCLKGVSWKESVQRYEADVLRNIMEARRKLLAGESVHKGFIEFDLHERGKRRHIRSIHISERVVQKCLCDNVLVPILSNSLIYDNGASVKGKGVHFAIRRLITHMTKYYRMNNRSNEGYALLIDFSKFFDSVDHKVLFEQLDGKIKDPRLRHLTKGFIRVFGDGKSLGLGSQVSQICAIFFPDRLDHYIKERLQIRYYGRYMDDLYLLHQSKAYLKYCLEEILVICERLKITVNLKKTRIVRLSQGVNFLKGRYILLPSGKVLRRPGPDSARRMRRKLGKFKSLLEKKQMTYEDIRTSYQSWRGSYKRRFHAYHRVRNLDKYYNELFISDHPK
uniref:Reverse transcriptase domain-containing protein n=1 Tax=uncultured bacterium contig00055 TaxID=1181539 RepID=A0A806KN32_9BACT|nr:hypothetical protein [uncultured bacterium contig00055]